MKKIVLVHGLPDHSGTWEKLIPIISGISNEIAIIGLPGIGDNNLLNEQSTLFELANLLISKIPFSNATYIGHDFGAILGTVIASLKPELISNLVLINGSTPNILREQIRNNNDQATRSKYAEKIILNPEQTLTYNNFIFLKAYLFKEEIQASDLYKKSLVKMWNLSLTQKNIGTYYRAFMNTQIDPIKFNHKALQIWSTKDPFIGPTVQQLMKSEFKDHNQIDIETDSHWPQISHTDHIGKVIENFLGEL